MEERQQEFEKKREHQPAGPKPKQSEVGKVIDAFTKSAARTFGTSIGREIIRGILGSLGSFLGGGPKKR
jgi:hypothetical protein